MALSAGPQSAGALTVTPLGPIVGAVAGLLDRPTAEVTSEVLPVVRDLLLDGFLRVG